MPSHRKVLVLGLDGATWDLLETWASKGLLPTIEKLRRSGAWGPLRTTIPPVTPSCWNSMYTGTNPGKHGIFGFFQRRPDSYRLSPVHASARKTKTIFRLLSDAGLKVGALNAPATYPPEAINGFLVPGIPTPEQAVEYTHPPELAAELQAVTQGKHKYPPGMAQATADVQGFFDSCAGYARAVTSAAKFMMERLQDWDLFFVQFQVTDAVQHHFWHSLDPDHPKHDPDAPEKVGTAILDVYQTVDQCLKEILAKAGRNVDVLVVSDHGGGAFHEQIYFNNWLWQQGWLTLKRTPPTLLRRAIYGLGITPELVRRQLYARTPKAVRRSVEARKNRFLALADRFFLSLDDVDWERTRAYCYGSPIGSMYVNLKGREPQGCVSPEEYETVLSQLEEDLKRMRHPKTGEPLVETVLRSADLYCGPFAKDGPDLQVLTHGLKYHNVGFLQFQSRDWIGPPRSGQTGHHTLDGILVMSGPHASSGLIDGASILDIAPTILTLLGQPIPDWMDGKVLADALNDEFLKESAPEVVHREEAVASEAPTTTGYTAEDEAQIAKRLADLGYLE